MRCLTEILSVAVGGAIGCICRYMVDNAGLFDEKMYDTVLINLVGCLLIGVVWSLLLLCGSSATAQLLNRLLITGLLGGFTTFSAFSLHQVQMLRDGRLLEAAGYLSVSVVGGLLACALGIFLTERIAKLF